MFKLTTRETMKYINEVN